MQKLIILILFNLLYGCLAPPPISELGQRESEKTKTWIKWQTKWSSYKLGDFDQIKDIMHAVSFSNRSNLPTGFRFSHDRIYNVSGKANFYPHGKLRWANWEEYKGGSSPWREPIYIDELIANTGEEMSYSKTIANGTRYIHQFKLQNKNFFFEGDKLIEAGKFEVILQNSNQILHYTPTTGEVSKNKKHIATTVKDGAVTPARGGVIIKGKIKKYFIPSDRDIAVLIPSHHKVLGRKGSNIYTLNNQAIYKFPAKEFRPSIFKRLQPNEKFFVLDNKLLSVNTAKMLFRVGSQVFRYGSIGNFEFLKFIPGKNEILFIFENSFTSKRLVSFNADTGKFSTIFSSYETFASNRFIFDSIDDSIEWFHEKIRSRKRARLLIDVFSNENFPTNQYIAESGRAWLEDYGSYARIKVRNLYELNNTINKLLQLSNLPNNKVGIIVRDDLGVKYLQQIMHEKKQVGALLLKDPAFSIPLEGKVKALPPIYILSHKYESKNFLAARLLVRELYQMDADYYFIEKISPRKFWNDYYQEYKAVRASEFAFFALHL